MSRRGRNCGIVRRLLVEHQKPGRRRGAVPLVECAVDGRVKDEAGVFGEASETFGKAGRAGIEAVAQKRNETPPLAKGVQAPMTHA